MRTALRRARARRQPGVLVLRYHRIAELNSDPHAVAVHPQSFREHLEILRSHYITYALSQVVRALQQGSLPEDGVVVTFDDGYADNLWEAKPALEQYETPATVFVATGYIGRGREFWWDELERVLLQPGTLPSTLRLDIDGTEHSWKLGRAARYSEDEYTRHRSWNWRRRRKPTGRHRLFRRLFKLLQPMGEQGRDAVLQALNSWAGTETTVRPTHRVLTQDELIQLADGALLEIGAHSVTHRPLSQLPPAEQIQEIQDSKAFLQDALDGEVECFAYPYGEAGNTAELVRKAGFTSACSTAARIVHPGDDPYHLPRLYVGNWDGEEFERQIRSLA
jgi:peptidoglycan/xylan/chitin deacetylase (PgdA/CDA1 family)